MADGQMHHEPKAAKAHPRGLSAASARCARTERTAEIERYVQRLGEFGVSLTDLTRRCPSRPETREAARAVASWVANDPALYARLISKGSLPTDTLARQGGVAQELLERHRPYIIALALACGTEFPHLRTYLHA